MAKHRTISTATQVRTRRAYFDCRYGQLHVRTGFPGTGGFDEGVTLFCLHPSEGSSRIFDKFLPEMAEDRSVYAPDLPGYGESDAAPEGSFEEAANAVADLAKDLRLRQIDLLGFRFGAGVALALAAARSDLVRRLVLVGVPPIERMPPIAQEALVLRVKLGSSDDAQWARGMLPRARFLELAQYSADMFDADPKALVGHVAPFLAAKP